MLQYRRLITIRNCASRLLKGDKAEGITQQIDGNLKCFLKDIQDVDACGELIEHLNDRVETYRFNYFTLTKYAERILKQYNIVKTLRTREGKVKFKVKLEGKGGA